MIIYSDWYLKLIGMEGTTLFGIIIILKKYKNNPNVYLLNHEKIHVSQWLETLFVGFLVLYILNFLWNLLRYKNFYEAYKFIIFEREAYKEMYNLNYIEKRFWCNWIKY